MFTKQEIKDNWFAKRDAAIAEGKQPLKAGITLALLILSSSLFDKQDWNGQDYTTHPIHVGFNNTRSSIKQIIGILHDCVEDSDWTVADLRELGFPKRVCDGVEAVTKKDNENYVEFIERCGTAGEDAIDIKIEDLEHNSTNTRAPHIVVSPHMELKSKMYNIAYFYLVDIKKGKIEPGTRIIDFIANHPVYSKNPKEANEILAYFSHKPDRLPEVKPGLSEAFSAPNPA